MKETMTKQAAPVFDAQTEIERLVDDVLDEVYTIQDALCLILKTDKARMSANFYEEAAGILRSVQSRAKEWNVYLKKRYALD
jgi:hypothetical protein